MTGQTRWADFNGRLNITLVAFTILVVLLAALPYLLPLPQPPLSVVAAVAAVAANEAVKADESWRDYKVSLKGIIIPDGRSAPVAGTLAGWVDGAEEEGGIVVLHGWAVDTKDMSPAPTVIVFRDGRAVAKVVPAVERGDVAAHFNALTAERSGFRVTVAGALASGQIRVFAMDRARALSELSYTPGVRLGGR